MDWLGDRVEQFNKLELPGQPQMMHMATSFMVNDLWIEVERLRRTLKGLHDEMCEPENCRLDGENCTGGKREKTEEWVP